MGCDFVYETIGEYINIQESKAEKLWVINCIRQFLQECEEDLEEE